MRGISRQCSLSWKEWKTYSNGVPGAAARSRAISLLSGGNEPSDLSIQDRAFAYRLFRESVIWRKRLDLALARLCKKPLLKLDPAILAALRIGAVQLIVLGTAPHAAVSSTVEAVKGHRAAGLVNAVLRRLSREGEPSLEKSPLHEIWSHPADLTERWISRYGRQKTAELMEWNNSVPELGACFVPETIGLRQGRYLGDYGILPRTGGNILTHMGEELYIQDEATAVVARGTAELAQGNTVLDLCAAPGGKTHHLCRTARLVIAVDSSPDRMTLWQENRARINWPNCFAVVALGESLPLQERFDIVLIDAPCTNTGVYRRRADARWNWSEDLLGRCVRSQRSLLESAADAVAPGGILIYSTCSMEPEENICQVDWFESNLSVFSRIGFPAPDVLVNDGLISIFPPEHGIDGIFAAAWRRNK